MRPARRAPLRVLLALIAIEHRAAIDRARDGVDVACVGQAIEIVRMPVPSCGQARIGRQSD
jgi:hypothetical protein